MVSRLGNLSLGYGALAGGLLTAPLVGLLYLVDKLVGLPFVPFALFDWICVCSVPSHAMASEAQDLEAIAWLGTEHTQIQSQLEQRWAEWGV